MKPYSMERRDLLRHACCGVAGLAVGLGMPHAFAATGNRTELTPDQVLALLKEGNEHFVANQASAAKNHGARRLEIARAQAPIAVLVGCSDSRVSPEILFGRGLGELFIIRNAGNTVDLTAQGSIEHACWRKPHRTLFRTRLVPHPTRVPVAPLPLGQNCSSIQRGGSENRLLVFPSPGSTVTTWR